MRKKTKTIKPTAPFKVGIYQLGYVWTEVWLNPLECGGDFHCMPGNCRDPQKPKQPARLTIGTADRQLWCCWGVLVHEALENLLCDLGVRFRASAAYSASASDTFVFHFNHNQFSEASLRLGSFLCEVRADFEKAWKRCQK